MLEDINEPDPIEIIEPIVEKPSLGDRILRDQAARLRRKEVKEAKALHDFKEQKEARERLHAKRRMKKLHRQKNKKIS
jgi:hypothetical protein